jgi:plasmid replication initiation protein
MKDGCPDLVCKSNRLIEASYRLSMVEQQIILFSIARAREADILLTADTPVTIDAKDFALMFGSNPIRVYEQLREAMDALYERSVLIYEVDQATGKEKVTKSRWISTASYISGAGQVQIIFAPKVIPFITRPIREFTRYQIEQISGMSSIYAIRIYELLIQYKEIKKRVLQVSELREMLALEQNEYHRIFDFKKWVIDVAVSQINNHSDLIVSYEQKKTGREVTHFTFFISQKTEDKPKKLPKLSREYIEQHAHPGENYEEASKRLSKKRTKMAKATS